MFSATRTAAVSLSSVNRRASRSHETDACSLLPTPPRSRATRDDANPLQRKVTNLAARRNVSVSPSSSSPSASRSGRPARWPPSPIFLQDRFSSSSSANHRIVPVRPCGVRSQSVETWVDESVHSGGAGARPSRTRPRQHAVFARLGTPQRRTRNSTRPCPLVHRAPKRETAAMHFK